MRLAVESRCRTVPVTVASSGRPTGNLRPPLPLGTRWARIARVVLLGALLLAVGVLALRAQRWRQRRAALAELSLALRSYTECMLGTPLVAGETAAARMRRIEAGLPEATTSLAAGAPEDAWPLRCREDVDRARAIIAGSVALAGDPAALRVDALLVRARTDPTPADAPGLVDDLLAAVPSTGASATPRPYPPPSGHLAPPPASPLAAAALTPLPVPVRSAPDEIAGIDPLTLRLSFFDPKDAVWTCAFTPLHGEPLREARCGEAARGSVSIVRDDMARGPGFLRTVHGRFNRFELVRPAPEGDPDVTALPSSLQTVALYGDQLVWVTAHRWYARTVGPGHTPLGPPIDLGEVTGISPELAACPTKSALLVGLKTFDDGLDARRSWRAMAAREGGEWQRTRGGPSWTSAPRSPARDTPARGPGSAGTP